jgi:prepilin-type N-terminal cleavage/methylation domain-containing protein
MSRRAFTLLEMVCVLTTLAILAGIATPAFMSAKMRAGEAWSMGNMRQFATAIALYRSDYEATGAGSGDNITSIGLPPGFLDLVHWAHLPKEMLNTGGSPQHLGDPPVYTWMVPPPGRDTGNPSWQHFVDVEGENAVDIIDDTHGNEVDAGAHLFISHRVLGLHLDGHVSTKIGPGPLGSYWFWSDSL